MIRPGTLSAHRPAARTPAWPTGRRCSPIRDVAWSTTNSRSQLRRMVSPSRRAHRPALRETFDFLPATGELPGERGEVAHACAAAVLRAGRTGSRPAAAAVGLADTVGLDELARLWRDAAPYSLPGVLWSLYVLRAWCRTSPQEVAQIYAAGRQLAAGRRGGGGCGRPTGADGDHGHGRGGAHRCFRWRLRSGPGTSGGVPPHCGGRRAGLNRN